MTKSGKIWFLTRPVGADRMEIGVCSESKPMPKDARMLPRAILICLSFICASIRLSSADLPEYRVTVVRDDDSWYIDDTAQQFIQELQPLAKDQYKVNFDHDLNAKGAFDRENATLTENNLALERLRLDIGAADPSERGGRVLSVNWNLRRCRGRLI